MVDDTYAKEATAFCNIWHFNWRFNCTILITLKLMNHWAAQCKWAKSLCSAKTTVVCRSMLGRRWELVLSSHRKQETCAAWTIATAVCCFAKL